MPCAAEPWHQHTTLLELFSQKTLTGNLDSRANAMPEFLGRLKIHTAPGAMTQNTIVPYDER